MNIDLLSKMVKELILDSDCVALPGFGVFIAETVPATFSDKGYTLNPPYRRLHFRTRDVRDDDALAALYASSNGVGLDVARTIVSDFTQELKTVLQKNKVVIFPGLGRLRATRENNFFFVSDEELDIYPAGFGLESISLKTHQETKEEVAAVVEDLADILKDEVVSMSALPVQETVQDTPEDNMAEIDAGQNEDSPEETADELKSDIQSDPSAEPGHEQVPVAETVTPVSRQKAPQDNKSGKHDRKTLKTILAVIGVAAGVLALALLIFLVLAEACPDFIDSILYSDEELKILNTWDKL